jgi:hypothetical protein
MLYVQEGRAGTIEHTLVTLIPQGPSPQDHKTLKSLPLGLVYLSTCFSPPFCEVLFIALRNNTLKAGRG